MANSSTARSGRRRRRGPARITISVPSALAEVLDVVALLENWAPAQTAASMVLATLAEARTDPVVVSAIRARRAGAGLYAVGECR